MFGAALNVLRRLIPNPTPRVVVASRLAASAKYTPEVAVSDINMTLLLPDNDQHRQTFTRIITDKRIVLTSSWIDKWFGVESLKSYMNKFAFKLELAADGDKEVSIPPELLAKYKAGESPVQIALDRFFSSEDNAKKLAEIYLAITSSAPRTGLGYFKFEDKKNVLVGGGALAPIVDNGFKDRVDIALHILDQKKGIGSACLTMLLEEAFQRRGVQEVWGSSLMDHRITPTLCARHGMIIDNDKVSGMKCYFIDKAMWEASRGKSKIVERSPVNAATHYSR